jgi:hypothetical protein
MNNELQTIEGAEIISAQDLRTNFGLVDQDTVINVARNLVEHYRGKVAGGYMPVTDAQLKTARKNGVPDNWRQMPDQDGTMTYYRPGGKKEEGDLYPPDAVRVVQKTFSRGLNPMAHISIWYQGGQLIDNLNYTIVKGMAEQQEKSSFEFVEMDSDERTRHGLTAGDIGKVAYLILDKDKSLKIEATMAFVGELGFAEAKRQALEMVQKARGIGIVKKGSVPYPPNGRSIDWVAEKRAMVDACRRAFGEMTPAQIAHYANGQGFVKQEDLAALASPDYQTVAQLPSDAQQRYLEMDRITQSVKAMPADELQAKVAANRAIMYQDDDDPLELSPEDDPDPVEDEASQVPPELAELRQALADEAAANPRQGEATEKQAGLIRSKLEEVFAGPDSLTKCNAVLGWLFNSPTLTFGQAQALLGRLLCKQDPKTGDYPIQPVFVKNAKAILVQAKKEAE